jgi:uridine phosphorylase
MVRRFPPVSDPASPAAPPAWEEEALIQPRRRRGEAEVTPTVVLTFAAPDFRRLCRLTHAAPRPRYLWDCALRQGVWEGVPLTMTAPALGAPYAAMVTERLIALGARNLFILGWCGSLHPGSEIGHLFLPLGALPGDGTSPHYAPNHDIIPADDTLCGCLAARLRDTVLPWGSGLMWSTDALYRETPALLRRCREQGAMAIDLELAALLAVACFRGVRAAGLYIVSDELFASRWRAAGASPEFRLARETAARLVLEAAREAHHA